jgi:SAM-dependent methyltransferase
MNSDPISLPLHIRDGAIVLDVGSGHRPHPRADVLCEKYLDDDTQRGSAAVVDRPLVLGDIQSLPFRPGAFDYIITRHILEHLDDPDTFFREITRVSKAGYIETPSLIWEHLHPERKYHKWVLLKIDDTIVMAPKPPALYDSALGSAIEQLGFNSLEYGLLIKAYLDLFYVRYEWTDAVRYQVYRSIDQAPDLFRRPWTAETARPWIPRRGAKHLLRNLIDSVIGHAGRGYLIRREARQVKARMRRRPIDLAQLMMCPVCGSTQIQISGGTARCRDGHWQTTILTPR